MALSAMVLGELGKEPPTSAGCKEGAKFSCGRVRWFGYTPQPDGTMREYERKLVRTSREGELPVCYKMA